MKKLDSKDKKADKSGSGIFSRRGFLKSAIVSTTVQFSVSAFSKENRNTDSTKSDPLFWGDLHTHTNLSDGNGSPEDNFEIARSHLDFWTMADHAFDKTVFDLDYRKMRKGRKILNDNWGTV